MFGVTGPFNVAGRYAARNLVTGQPPTRLYRDDFNRLFDELTTLVEGAGLTLNQLDNTQVLQAVLAIAGSGGVRNSLINGDFLIWQRSTSNTFTSGTARYTADRWIFDPGSGNTNTAAVARVAFSLGQTDVDGDPRYYLDWQQDSGLNGSADGELSQRINQATRFNARKATLSFWARTNSGTTTLTPRLEQNFGTGGSPSSTVVIGGTAEDLTTTWKRYFQTFDVPSTAGKTFGNNHFLALVLQAPQAFNGRVHIARIQLEAGGKPTNFESQTEAAALADCRRYFQKSWPIGSFVGSFTFQGASFDWASGTSLYSLAERLPVAMRASPTITRYSIANPPVSGDVTRIDPSTGTQTAVAVSSIVAESDTSTGYVTVSSFTEGYVASHWTAESEL